MHESILGFSGVELFGHRVGELAIVDPGGTIWVDHWAGEENLDKLEGLPKLGNTNTAAGDLVLVTNQSVLLENGIYRVMGARRKWKRLHAVPVNEHKKYRPLKEGVAIRVWADDEKKKNNARRQYHILKSIGHKAARCTLTLNAVQAIAAEIESIRIDKTELLSAPVETTRKLAPEILAEILAEAISDDTNSGHKATHDGKVVTIGALKKGAAGNDLVVEVKASKVDVTVSGSDPKNSAVGKTFGGDNIYEFEAVQRLGANRRRGENRQLERQLRARDATFARIYGFSYENVYYDLSYAVLFLVHGDGELVTQEHLPGPQPARAPRAAELTGLAAPGFDFADELRVWSYDKADYTVRMDVDTGMFEQVLLETLVSGAGMEASGMNARGMNAQGMNARGMNARGMNARGMNARGMNARGSSD